MLCTSNTSQFWLLTFPVLSSHMGLVAILFDPRALEKWIKGQILTYWIQVFTWEVFISISDIPQHSPIATPQPWAPRTCFIASHKWNATSSLVGRYTTIFSYCKVQFSCYYLLVFYSTLNFNPWLSHTEQPTHYCLQWYLPLSKKMKTVIRFVLSTRCSSEIIHLFWWSPLPNCWGVSSSGVI